MRDTKNKNGGTFGTDFQDDFFGEEGTTKKDEKEKTSLGDADVLKLRRLAEEMKERANAILSLLDDKGSEISIVFDRRSDAAVMVPQDKETGRVIEGVFDGQNMVGPDGKQYSVPANYASKSKLVEGDILKLTITTRGSFIYKQIHPVERERLLGTLRVESEENYTALVGDRKYKLLKASVTYFKGEDEDEVVLLVPKDKISAWAAVENMVKG